MSEKFRNPEFSSQTQEPNEKEFSGGLQKSEDGKSWIGLKTEGDEQVVVFNGKEVLRVPNMESKILGEQIRKVAISKNGEHYGYIRLNKKTLNHEIHIDKKAVDKLGIAFKEDSTELDNEKPSYKLVDALQISDDGEHYACMARGENLLLQETKDKVDRQSRERPDDFGISEPYSDGWVVILDGKQMTDPVVQPGNLVLSKDGEQFTMHGGIKYRETEEKKGIEVTYYGTKDEVKKKTQFIEG